MMTYTRWGVTATIQDDAWACDDLNLLKLLDHFHWRDLDGYAPDKDYATALLAREQLRGGEVAGEAMVHTPEHVSSKPAKRRVVLRNENRGSRAG